MLVTTTLSSTMTPGITAATNSVVDESPSTSPMMMYAIDGGIRMPVQAPEATSAQA